MCMSNLPVNLRTLLLLLVLTLNFVPFVSLNAALSDTQSLRFNDGDASYMTRTPAGAGDQRTLTWSGWVKRGVSGGTQTLFGAGGANFTTMEVRGDEITVRRYSGGAYVWQIYSTPTFYDPSTWIHVVIAVDTTETVSTDRVKAWVNNERITDWSTASFPALNDTTNLNSAVAHYIGRYPFAAQYSDKYLSDVYLIDGQALDPSYFAGNDIHGNWKPRNYSGSYGTNGFHLNFGDRSSLGSDSSGNSNNWTLVNLDATDGVIDSPKNNFATLNPNENSGTLSNGNLYYTGGSTVVARSTMTACTGKYYWEIVAGSSASTRYTGVNRSDYTATDAGWVNHQRSYEQGGNKVSGSGSAYGSTWTTGDVIGHAIDLTSGKIWFSKNGVWQASGNPAAGTNAAFTDLTRYCWKPYAYNQTNEIFNFGQSPNPTSTATTLNYSPGAGGYFLYSPPDGFKAFSSYAPLSLTKPQNKLGLVAYWKFDESESATEQDYTGRGHTGTRVGNVTGIAGKRGNAISCDGSGDYVALGDSTDWQFNDDFSIQFWLRSTGGTGAERVVSQWEQTGGTDRAWAVQLSGGTNIQVYGVSGATIVIDALSSAAITPNTWHHIAVVRSGSALTIYIDGIADGADASASGALNNSTVAALLCGDFAAGAGSVTDFFQGNIDELQIFNGRALSQAEIELAAQSKYIKATVGSTADIQKGSSLESGLIGHWTFDGKYTTTSIADSYGSNNGYFIGGATSSAKTIGKLGQALEFDGTNDYVLVNSSAALAPSNMTVAFWMKNNTAPAVNHGVMGKTNLNLWTAGWGFFFQTAAEIRFFIQTFNANFAFSSIDTSGDWNHVVGTWDGATIRIYVNGVEGTSDTYASTITTTNPFEIGRLGTNSFNIDGALDDVRIYNRVFSATEVQKLYNLGRVKITR